MLQLAVASLRARWFAFLGIFATIAVAVALTTATGGLLESGIRGNIPAERLAGADVVVTGDQQISETTGKGDEAETATNRVAERVRVPDDLAEAIAAVPGVADVTADRTTTAGLDGAAVHVHGWSSSALAPYDLTSGRAPEHDDEVVVGDDAGRDVGDTVTLDSAGRRLELTVSGVVRALPHSPDAFLTDAAAARLYPHPGQVDLYAVHLEPGADTTQAAHALAEATGLEAVTGEDIGQTEHLEAADSAVRLIALSGSLGGIGLLVAILIVAGMLGLFVQQRHREVALLRAMGATARQVRRMLSRETLAVTLLGAAVGVYPGVLLADVLADQLRDRGVVPQSFENHTGWLPMGVAAASAVLVSWSACWVAGRRAARIKPVEALAEAAGARRSRGIVSLLAGLVAAAGTAVLFVVTQSVSASIAPAIMVGLFSSAVLTLTLLSRAFVGLGTRLLRPVLAASGTSGYLAGHGTVARSRRIASAVVPLALTVGVAGWTLAQQETLDDEAAHQSALRLTARHVVVSGPGGLPVDSPGTGVGSTTIYATDDLNAYPARFVTGGPVRGLLDLDVSRGSLADLAPGTIALSHDMAGGLHGRIGHPVHLRLGDGTSVDPTLVAVYDRSLGFGEALLPYADVADHLTDPVVDLVLSDRRVDPAPGARAGGPGLVQAAENADAETQALVNLLLLGLIVVFCAFAVLNTLILSVGERVRELALLRLVGASKRQVLAMLRWEALATFGLALVSGTAVGVVTVAPFAYALEGTHRFAVPLTATALVLLLAAALAWAGMLLPARAALRLRPVEAIGMRE